MSQIHSNTVYEERFWSKVHKTESCWIWIAARTDSGYGCMGFRGKVTDAHRVAYILLIGEIPEGLEIDHECHNRDKSCRGGNACKHRQCVNPRHLNPVTHQENSKRGRTGEYSDPGARQRNKTHCPKGHEYSALNTYYQKTGGGRKCRICQRHAKKRWLLKLEKTTSLY